MYVLHRVKMEGYVMLILLGVQIIVIVPQFTLMGLIVFFVSVIMVGNVLVQGDPQLVFVLLARHGPEHCVILVTVGRQVVGCVLMEVELANVMVLHGLARLVPLVLVITRQPKGNAILVWELVIALVQPGFQTELGDVHVTVPVVRRLIISNVQSLQARISGIIRIALVLVLHGVLILILLLPRLPQQGHILME